MRNIILMGPPGAGKTTVSKLLGQHFRLPVYDIDDHHLEVVWECPVAEKLAKLGDDGFLEAEGEAMFHLKKTDTIIALTGSNPLHKKGMDYIRSLGIVIYMDVPIDTIARRLYAMKVDRIVGMKNKTIEEVLTYRKDFYEQCYDIRITCGEYDTPSSICKHIIEALQKDEHFVSTRGWYKETNTFCDVVRQGLAPDGGLFIPLKFPHFFPHELQRCLSLSYQERTLRVLEKFPLGTITPQELKKMIDAAYESFEDSRIAPVTALQGNQYLLELFHGPTAAFKDMALQLTPKFFSKAIEDDGNKYLILAATSGDTGVAAIEGYKREKNIAVMVLYPKDGVSEVQKQQMLSAEGDNVFVLGVDADFDFCQSTVKKIFNDTELTQDLFKKYSLHLSSANSMNWGRLLPQVAYYVSAYLDLIQAKVLAFGDEIDVCVPTGNFGNLLAAYVVHLMGLPIKRFICASNDNNVLMNFFEKGIYDLRNRSIIQTSSPSIDILKSSNIERLLYLLTDGNTEETKKYMEELEKDNYFEVSERVKIKLKNTFTASYCTDEESLQVAQKTLKETGVLIDTHTAVAKKVADEFQEDRIMLIASTAHWSKFAPAMMQALGLPQEKTIANMFTAIQRAAPRTDVHPQILSILTKPLLHTSTAPESYNAIVQELKKFLERSL